MLTLKMSHGRKATKQITREFNPLVWQMRLMSLSRDTLYSRHGGNKKEKTNF